MRSILLAIIMILSGCTPDGQNNNTSDVKDTLSGSDTVTETVQEEEASDMNLMINDNKIPVTWESNASVDALRDLIIDQPLTIQMSMYGGFEQVGSIGQSIVRNDEQITANAGDIVLYSGNQIVVFYGSNSWAYTRLGHINLSQDELSDLLGSGDVKLVLEKSSISALRK